MLSWVELQPVVESIGTYLEPEEGVVVKGFEAGVGEVGVASPCLEDQVEAEAAALAMGALVVRLGDWVAMVVARVMMGVVGMVAVGTN